VIVKAGITEAETVATIAVEEAALIAAAAIVVFLDGKATACIRDLRALHRTATGLINP
jgi:hypothetical protein